MKAKVRFYFVCPNCGNRRAKRRGEPCGYCAREQRKNTIAFGEAAMAFRLCCLDK